MKFNVIPSVSSGYIIAVTFVHELKVYHKWLTHVKQPKNIYLLEKIKKKYKDYRLHETQTKSCTFNGTECVNIPQFRVYR